VKTETGLIFPKSLVSNKRQDDGQCPEIDSYKMVLN
jgi:hypothetical protein